MNFNQEFRKIKTANLLAIIIVIYILAFTIFLFFFKVPNENKELMNSMVILIVAMNGAVSGYLYGTRKQDEDNRKPNG